MGGGIDQGETHQVFAGRSDTCDLVRGITQLSVQALVRGIGIQSPQMPGIPNFNAIVIDMQVDGFLRPAGDNQTIIAGVLDLRTKVTPVIGISVGVCEG